ncbi:MAG TPA: SH3 domain-containing protein [Thermohalobaculum sp.]|nr:SH3 domain-containing protein [Thermohalobaculum sp.]
MWIFARVSPGIATLHVALALVIALAGPVGARAQTVVGDAVGPETNLPIPRFVSLRGGEVNVRRGPGLDYRIDWVFQRRGLPVRVIDEYGNWRRIADSDDAGGWVYHALLTAKRMALITAPEVHFRAEPEESAAATAKAEQGVVTHLLQCQPDWCRVEAEGTEGWVRKTAIWGVEPGEVFGD